MWVPPMSLYLEIVAHALTAILATWLGLLVFTRARQASGAPVFGFLSLLLVVWSVAIIGQRLGSNTEMYPLLNVFEDFGAFLLPAATAHLAISIALEGRTSRWATGIVAIGYGVGAAAWIQTALDPAHPILPAPPHFEPVGIPGEILGWGFILVRAGVFAAGLGWLVAALGRAGSDVARRRQLHATLVTLGLGIAGGMARILPEGVGGPAWLGVSLIAAAAAVAVYAVLGQRLFAGATLTTRAYRSSLLIGFGVVAYVAALVGVDRGFATLVGLDLPVIIALAIVFTIVLIDPISDLARRVLLGRDDQEIRLGRLLRALGEDALSVRREEELLAPALARLVRAFGLTGAALVNANDRPTIVHGDPGPIDALTTRLPVDAAHTSAVFGNKRSGLPLTPAEVELLRLAMSYVDAAIRLGARQNAQASELAVLSREGVDVEQRGAALSEALAAQATPMRGLRVYAMGALRAEINGEAVRSWGGPKAGSRQAEGIFAFLFDRGERGAAKDEIIELVWPDSDLDRADMAFHRTMLGLRSVFRDAGRARRENDGPIAFANDRYRLRQGLVVWSDVAEFQAHLVRAREVQSPAERIHLLEAARGLYRADLLDDCPFYGDSAEVEEHREEIRERYVDLLVDLGLAYAARGDRSAASDALRRATALTSRTLPVVSDALNRLDAAATASTVPAFGESAI
jgi:DNA-binding SARP family transcriptional activator